MAFNQHMIEQLNNPPQELSFEILEMLSASSPLTCLDMFKQSKIAITSRDISLAMSMQLKPKGLVEIERKERRPDTASEVAFWRITQPGKELLQSKSKTLPADNPTDYEPPIFGQKATAETVVAEIEKIIDAPKLVTDTPTGQINTSVEPDYSDKPKAYQILKYIEAHPGASTKEIVKHLGLKGAVTPYITGYIDRGEVKLVTSQGVGGVFEVTKPVDEFYGHGRKASTKKQPAGDNQNETISKQPQETTTKSSVEAKAPAIESQRAAEPEVQEATAEAHQSENVHDHPASKVRFSITSDKHIILMGLTSDDIELTEADSHKLIQFCGDIALAQNVSDAFATRMIDLELLGS